MGLPSIDIQFKKLGSTAIKRGNKGIVALILKDSASNGFISMSTIDDIPDTLSTDNKKQIELAMMGSVNPPKKVIAYVLPLDAVDYTDAQKYLETVKWDYLAVPEIGDAETTAMATWIKQLRNNKRKKVKAVLPNEAADHEGIINFATDNIEVGSDTYTAKKYCSRIAGLLAGTPLKMSATYQVLPEVTDVPHLTEDEFNTLIDAGKLVLMHDGEKVKVARAVNSLTTTTVDKGEDFKKIKIIDAADLMYSDITKTISDNYIGKIPNTYDNKCVLITAIRGYLKTLEDDELLEKGKSNVDINIQAQENYLNSIGIDTEDMSEQEIKEANTKDQVFLSTQCKFVDAMEDFDIGIEY